MSSSRVPLATYRLQLNAGFRFADAAGLIPYLADLGVGAVYLSPVFAARAGSPHGYDVIDPTRLNPELGTETEFRALAAAARERGIGIVLDIVPNHLAASVQNAWWMDVLEHGTSSNHAEYFDIDWAPASPTGTMAHQILLPLLGAPFGLALESQELKLLLVEGGFAIQYFEREFPVDPGSWGIVLGRVRDRLRERLGHDDPDAAAVARLIEAIDRVPERHETAPDEPNPRAAPCREIHSSFGRLMAARPAARAAVEDRVAEMNGVRGRPESFDELDDLLRRQAYRLAHWRLASESINYRRFFDIGGLVGVRVEEPRVFDATHALALRLLRDGAVTGLRIDHIDGLLDPQGYLERLRSSMAGGAGDGAYVVAEKILSGEERLPAAWSIDGTTGYEFTAALSGLFVDPEGLASLDQIYARFTGDETRFADLLYERKKRVIAELFGGEVRFHASELCRLAADDRHGRDLSATELERALIEVTACMPVYRTYTRELGVGPADRQVIEESLAEARRRAPEVGGGAFGFLRRVLLMEAPPHLSEVQRRAWLPFVMRWQQHTGPVTAKGHEDTALYQYSRLLSLNIVGGDPDPARTRLSVDAFHAHNQRQAAEHPHSMTSTSTHDSKRSEDVRARLHVLSEIPDAWARALWRWHRWNAPLRSDVGGHGVPVPEEESLIYQTLLGAWPLDSIETVSFRERIRAYVLKAAREAKAHTSWQNPDQEHEAALQRFVDGILDTSLSRDFLDDLTKFHAKIAFSGAVNSLAQVLAKIASPGVPDIYQGTELWTLTLVDPDNRRGVDFFERQRLLGAISGAEKRGRRALVRTLMARWTDGQIKMYVTRRALEVRRETHPLFSDGSYAPLAAEGPRSAHLCAFARRLDDRWALCVLPSRVARLTTPGVPPVGVRTWKKTSIRLPAGAPEAWENALTGEIVRASPEGTLAVAEILATLPVALLRPAPAGRA